MMEKISSVGVSGLKTLKSASDYFKGAESSFSNIADWIYAFSDFINQYLWIPIAIIIICVGVMVLMGNRGSTDAAKTWVVRICVGILIIVSAITIAGILVGMFWTGKQSGFQY